MLKESLLWLARGLPEVTGKRWGQMLLMQYKKTPRQGRLSGTFNHLE